MAWMLVSSGGLFEGASPRILCMNMEVLDGVSLLDSGSFVVLGGLVEKEGGLESSAAFFGLVGGIEKSKLYAALDPFSVPFAGPPTAGFANSNLNSPSFSPAFPKFNCPLRFVGLSCSTPSISLFLVCGFSFLALGGNLNAGLSKSFNSSLTRYLSSLSRSSISSCTFFAITSSLSPKGQFSRLEGSHNAANFGPCGIERDVRCFFRAGTIKASRSMSRGSRSSSLAEKYPGRFRRGVSGMSDMASPREGGGRRSWGAEV